MRDQGLTSADKTLISRKAFSLARRDPHAIVELARTYSTKAVQFLARIMDDDKQPVATRVRCAEVLIERGYGKAPLAVLVGTEPGTQLDGRTMTIAERIVALKMAQERGGQTLELEGSAVHEPPQDRAAIEVEVMPRPAPPPPPKAPSWADLEIPTTPAPEDLIG